MDDGEFGIRAGELVEQVNSEPGEAAPSWLSDVGDAEIIGAAVMCEDVFDDATTVVLEARHPGGETHAVGVLIDNNLGGVAKDILLADSIDRIVEVMRKHPAQGGELVLERIAPGVAAGSIHAAIELTEMTLDPPVAEDYAWLRALALVRADEAPKYIPMPERDEMPHEERDRLRDEFLASPEGSDFAPGSDEAWAASLAIDFCADYVDGRPLRWSPVVVELFMANWIPREGARRSGSVRAIAVSARPLGAGSQDAKRARQSGRWRRPRRRSRVGATRWSSAAAIWRRAVRRSSS